MNNEKQMPFESRKRKMGEISIVPLINVVFLLLIFFLVSGTATDPDKAIIDVPEADSAEPLPESEIEIAVLENGSLLLNNQPVTEKGLLVTLQAMLKNDPKAAVTLKADGKALANQLTATLKQVTEAGAENVRLVTQQKLGE